MLYHILIFSLLLSSAALTAAEISEGPVSIPDYSGSVEVYPTMTDCKLWVMDCTRYCPSELKYAEAGSNEWKTIQHGEKHKLRGVMEYELKDLKPGTLYAVEVKTERGIQRGQFRTYQDNIKPVFLLTATFENCGFEIPDKLGKSCEVEYREKRGQWKKPLPFQWISPEYRWRGVMTGLKEDTIYEVKGIVSGHPIQATFRTHSSNFPVAETREITKLPLVIGPNESGKASGWIRYTADKPLRGSIALKNAKYVLLDQITLNAEDSPDAVTLQDSQDIAIRNCNISGYGRCGKQIFEKNSLFGNYGINGVWINYDSGIRITHSSRILVEKCYIHAPASGSNSWYFSHPAGPNAIFMNSANKEVVIRWNDLVARDTKRWNDVIEGGGNGRLQGGFGCEADIYGNLFSMGNDDAIELDGTGCNLRFYYNRVENTLSGISTGRCSRGPVYIFNNLFSTTGDQNGTFNAVFKNGHAMQGWGPLYMLNNTLTPNIGSVYHHIHSMPPTIPITQHKLVMRGNLFTVHSAVFEEDHFAWPISLDHNHYVFVNQDSLSPLLKKMKQEQHGSSGPVEYTDAARGIYTLKSGNYGAFANTDAKTMPLRPGGLTADAAELFTAGHTLKFTVTSPTCTAFHVDCNDDFFKVEPASGVLEAEKAQTFTATILPEKLRYARIYRGVAMIRRPDGISVPISLAWDRRNLPIPGVAITNGSTVTIPHDGIYFLLVVTNTARRFPLTIQLENQEVKVTAIPVNKTESNISRLMGSDNRVLFLNLKKGEYQVKMNSKEVSMKSDKLILTENPIQFYFKMRLPL